MTQLWSDHLSYKWERMKSKNEENSKEQEENLKRVCVGRDYRKCDKTEDERKVM